MVMKYDLRLLFLNIQRLCDEKGVSIAELERESGLGNGVIRKWSKASPNLRTVTAVAQYLGVSLDELLLKRK